MRKLYILSILLVIMWLSTKAQSSNDDVYYQSNHSDSSYQSTYYNAPNFYYPFYWCPYSWWFLNSYPYPHCYSSIYFGYYFHAPIYHNYYNGYYHSRSNLSVNRTNRFTRQPQSKIYFRQNYYGRPSLIYRIQPNRYSGSPRRR